MPEAAQPTQGSLRLGAVILAAGGSSRMGSVKQLLEVGGRSLVARAVDAALGSHALPVVVVLGANAERVAAAIADRPVLSARNADWMEGMASSIRTGLSALLGADPSLDAVLVTPCDQPALSSDMITMLAALHRATGRVSAARYCGRNGAPAIFGRGHFDTLMALTGDEGARKLLNSNSGKVVAIDFPELGVDLDTPADYADWNGRRTQT
jgi:molybdenum cofactor cytidylyltransferase